MIEIDRTANGRVQISIDRGGDSNRVWKTPNIVEVDLWHNLGYVQIGCNDKYIPVRRLLNVGNKTSAIVGDYKITVERIAVTNNKIIKLRPEG